MKSISLLLLFLLPAFISGQCQDTTKYAGTWEGKLSLGIEIRIVFHIAHTDAGALTASADSPDQNAYGMKCDTTFISPAGITIEMRAIKASFTGRLSGDSVIEGVFTQRQAVPLVLARAIHPSPPRKAPQAPQPPFPYRSEDVEFDSKDGALHYGGTLTIPPGKGVFPAVLLITGSGAQNRDEEILGHKTFAMLADALSRNGLVVLRVDDRGIGKTTGVFADATSADFMQDVNTSLDFLLTRPEVDKKKTGLIGHSEGGMIAPAVATGRKDVAFVILLAAPGIKLSQLMSEQNTSILRSVNISQRAVSAYAPLYSDIMKEITTAPDTVQAKAKVMEMARQWAASTDTGVLRELGVASEKGVQDLALQLVRGFSGKWFRYFLSFDPQPYLEKMTGKVLAINGDRDIQVIAVSNLPGIEAALKKSRVKSYMVKTIPGVNHLFQTCIKCTVNEYGELEETFSPVALQVINDWLDKNIK